MHHKDAIRFKEPIYYDAQTTAAVVYLQSMGFTVEVELLGMVLPWENHKGDGGTCNIPKYLVVSHSEFGYHHIRQTVATLETFMRSCDNYAEV